MRVSEDRETQGELQLGERLAGDDSEGRGPGVQRQIKGQNWGTGTESFLECLL